MKLFIAAYITQGEGNPFFGGTMIIHSQAIWAINEDEARGLLLKEETPPENVKNVLLQEVTPEMAQYLLDHKEEMFHAETKTSKERPNGYRPAKVGRSVRRHRV